MKAERDLRNFIVASGFGAALMYFFDPQQGRGRRARALDQALSFLRDSQEEFSKAKRDLQGRLQGVYFETMGLLGDEQWTDDQTLQNRVRSSLGRYVSHPRSVKVDVMNGKAVLSGRVLRGELSSLISAVRSTKGVQDVESRIEEVESSQGIPEFQGGREISGERWEIAQKNWSPSFRLAVSTGAMLLATGAAYALLERGESRKR